MRRLLGALLLFLLPLAALAFSGSIVDAAFVEKAGKRGAIVWDIRPASGYDLGHIPGAINIGFVAEALVDAKTQQFLSVETIAARLGGAGIDLTREIVVYGGPGSSYAYFTQFALEYFGARRVHVFHQGIDGWKAAKKPVSTLTATRKPVKVRPFANPALVATTGEVVGRVGAANVQFVDVRSLAEFTGEQVADTLNGGHIPGAIHIPHMQNYVDPDAMRRIMAKETTDTSGLALKDRAALRRLYAALDPKKETIVYCHVGVRASMTAAVLARLGFHSVRVYQGSWFEYGNLPDAPVEKVVTDTSR